MRKLSVSCSLLTLVLLGLTAHAQPMLTIEQQTTRKGNVFYGGGGSLGQIYNADSILRDEYSDEDCQCTVGPSRGEFFGNVGAMITNRFGIEVMLNLAASNIAIEQEPATYTFVEVALSGGVRYYPVGSLWVRAGLGTEIKGGNRGVRNRATSLGALGSLTVGYDIPVHERVSIQPIVGAYLHQDEGFRYNYGAIFVSLSVSGYNKVLSF